jgi:hypothetical protein
MRTLSMTSFSVSSGTSAIGVICFARMASRTRSFVDLGMDRGELEG